MSKIAEQKALEEYPEIEGTETYFNRDYICTKPIDLNRQNRIGYVKGYDHAFQYFMEKAMEYFKGKPIHHFWVEHFKKYMEEQQ